MMKRQFLLLALILSVASSVSAEEVQIDKLWYSLSGTTAEVIQYKDNVKYSGDIVISNTVSYNNTDYTVTSIGDRAFGYCSGLTSITIPNSVTSIGESAFSECRGLTSITIPNSVTSIGDYTFGYCRGLTSITIPNSVTSIGDYAFHSCSGLISVTIPVGVTSIGRDVFAGCSGLTSVTIPNGVTSIGDHAFMQCSGLMSITIPNSVASIGDIAFNGCSGLKSIAIPNSVTSIGYNAFSGCSGLTAIVVEEGNSKYDSRNGCNAVVETSSNTLLCGCQSTIIPNSVTSIGSDAFYSCNGLTSITIPSSVTSIGRNAFGYCNNLTSITIENGVTSIGYLAFAGCSGLTDVYCYAEEVPTTNSDTFYGTSISDVTLHVPAASVNAYKAVAPWEGFKKVVALTGQGTGIGGVSGNSDAEVARYTMGGQHIYRHAKGLNVIRMSNGKTKKEVVK